MCNQQNVFLNNKNLIYIYIYIYIYKEDLALNNIQWLIRPESQAINQPKILKNALIRVFFSFYTSE